MVETRKQCSGCNMRIYKEMQEEGVFLFDMDGSVQFCSSKCFGYAMSLSQKIFFSLIQVFVHWCSNFRHYQKVPGLS